MWKEAQKGKGGTQTEAKEQKTKIRHIWDDAAAVVVLDRIKKAFLDDHLKEFILIARIKDKTGSSLHYNWFGEETALYHLGLCDRMKQIIHEHIMEEGG